METISASWSIFVSNLSRARGELSNKGSNSPLSDEAKGAEPSFSFSGSTSGADNLLTGTWSKSSVLSFLSSPETRLLYEVDFNDSSVGITVTTLFGVCVISVCLVVVTVMEEISFCAAKTSDFGGTGSASVSSGFSLYLSSECTMSSSWWISMARLFTASGTVSCTLSSTKSFFFPVSSGAVPSITDSMLTSRDSKVALSFWSSSRSINSSLSNTAVFISMTMISASDIGPLKSLTSSMSPECTWFLSVSFWLTSSTWSRTCSIWRDVGFFSITTGRCSRTSSSFLEPDFATDGGWSITESMFTSNVSIVTFSYPLDSSIFSLSTKISDSSATVSFSTTITSVSETGSFTLSTSSSASFWLTSSTWSSTCSIWRDVGFFSMTMGASSRASCSISLADSVTDEGWSITESMLTSNVSTVTFSSSLESSLLSFSAKISDSNATGSFSTRITSVSETGFFTSLVSPFFSSLSSWLTTPTWNATGLFSTTTGVSSSKASPLISSIFSSVRSSDGQSITDWMFTSKDSIDSSVLISSSGFFFSDSSTHGFFSITTNSSSKIWPASFILFTTLGSSTLPSVLSSSFSLLSSPS